MSVPSAIADAIRKINGIALPGILAQAETACEGSKHHSPQPLIVQDYEVTREGLIPVVGLAVSDTSVWLCGTCASNVEVMLSLMRAHNGALPWETRRAFGNLVRSVAQRAYKEGTA